MKSDKKLIIEELRDFSFQKVISKGYNNEYAELFSDRIGNYNSAIIPLFPGVVMMYFSGVPTQTFQMRYSQYHQDKISLNLCLSGQVLHEKPQEFSVVVRPGESFIYDVKKDRTLIEFEEGEKFEQVCLVFDRKQFYNCLERFFDESSKAERDACLEAIFSENQAGKVFAISKEVKLICKQIIACRLKDRFREVFLECKLFELLSYYFQSFSIGYDDEICLSESDIKQIHQAKSILSKQEQIQNLSVEDLCKEVGLNRFKLNTGFQTLFNTSVIKFYRSIVLAKAHSELVDKSKKVSVSKLAEKYGYSSASAFSNAFFKEFGIRPKDV